MFKNLPKDLLAAASNILDESSTARKAKYRAVVKEALKKFKVRSFGDLSETEQRIFSEWVTQRIDVDEDCGCSDSDDLLHKQAKVNAQSGLPELGEEDEEDKERIEGPAAAKKAAPVEESDVAPDENRPVNEDDGEESEFSKQTATVSEDCEYASPEPCSSIGSRLGVEQPKHADVIRDTDALNGGAESFRLLIQFVNGRPEFVPPVTLPGAPSIEALGELVGAFDDDAGVVSRALADALDIPSQRPEFRGNDLAESKKKIKKILSESTIDVEGLETELELMALNNYPQEYAKRDVNALLNHLIRDVKRMSEAELHDEIDDLLPNLKKTILKSWKS